MFQRRIFIKTLTSSLALWIAGVSAQAQETPAPTGGPTLLSDAFSEESFAQTRLDEFTALLDEAAGKDDFVGLAVAVVRDGEIALLKTYGVREAGGSAPVTPDTVFRLASVSKGFSSSLAAMAIQEGRLSADTPVTSFAPRLALPGGGEAQATLTDILSHRVGLPPYAYDNLLEAGTPVKDILPKFRSVKPICKVGRCYAYQNITYNLVGDALASAYGAPYEELVRDRIFTPLGMRTASLGAEGLEATGNWARPHKRQRIKGEAKAFGPWEIAKMKDAYYRTPAAGGVNASILDMAAWLKAQMHAAPDVAPDAVLEMIHSPVVDTPAETRRWRSLSSRITNTKYGLGWRIYDYAGHKLVNHSGGVEGYGAQIAFLPERNIGIVILSNTRAERVWRILPTFLDIELGLPEEDWLALHEDEEAPAFASGQPAGGASCAAIAAEETAKTC